MLTTLCTLLEELGGHYEDLRDYADLRQWSFGHAGPRQVFVAETIQGWLDVAKEPTRGYDPEGIIHDLFVMRFLVKVQIPHPY